MANKETQAFFGIMFNVIAMFFVVAVSTNYWIDFYGIHSGLWMECSNVGCINLPNNDVDINTWRAFAVMACILAGVGSYARILGAIVESKAASIIGYLIFVLGCLCELVATGRYAQNNKLPDGVSPDDYYGWSV
jgi:hypothetical protein